MTPQFQALVDEYVRTPAISNDLKVASLSQWKLESGDGESELARQHLNFCGLKYRDRMRGFATPVQYEAHDGIDTYCKFESLAAFIDGYWRFVESGSTYEDPADYANDPTGYIEMLKAGGFAGDPDYVEKVVDLFPEATALLRESAERQGLITPPSAPSFRLGVVVGHNSVAQGAFSSHLGISEWPFNSRIAEVMANEAAKYSIVMETFFRTPEGGTTAEIERCYAEVDAWGADLILELHFNGGPSSANGTETLYWHASTNGRTFAMHVQREVLSSYGLRDRGLKPIQSGDAGAISLSASDAPTILGEPFFGSNQGDCNAVLARGEAALARAYLSGAQSAAVALGLTRPIEPPPPPPPVDTVQITLLREAAEDIARQLEAQLS